MDATYVFQKMAEFVDRGEQGDDRAQRAAADLGLYIMTHGFRIALEAEQVFLYRAQVKFHWKNYPDFPWYIYPFRMCMDMKTILVDTF